MLKKKEMISQSFKIIISKWTYWKYIISVKITLIFFNKNKILIKLWNAKKKNCCIYLAKLHMSEDYT